MKQELDPRLGFLAEHYRETFSHQREYIKQRDRLFVYALLATVALAFRATYTENSQRVLAVAIDKLLGETGVKIDEGFLGILVWFVFFALVARYFQATQNVERQYGYISKVEAEVTKLYGSDLFAREGTQYLKNYPVFGNWMHFIYSWTFPVAIALLAIWTAWVDLHRSAWSWNSLIVVMIAFAVVGTVAAYLYSTKFQEGAPWKKSGCDRKKKKR